MNVATKVTAVAALENDLSKIARTSADFLSSPRRLLIDGSWVGARSGRTFEVRDPSSDRVIAAVAEGASADVDLAVAAARRAFDDPSWLPRSRRVRFGPAAITWSTQPCHSAATSNRAGGANSAGRPCTPASKASPFESISRPHRCHWVTTRP